MTPVARGAVEFALIPLGDVATPPGDPGVLDVKET
jgi:hypothetical protein